MKKMMTTMMAALWMSSAIAANATDKQMDKNLPPHRMEMRQGVAPKKLSPAERTEYMTKELGLSKKQAKKVQALNEKYAGRMEGPGMGQQRPPKMDKDGQKGCENCKKQCDQKRPELSAEQKSKMDAEMKARQKARAEYDAELKSILTDKQFAKYQQQHGGHHGHHGKPRIAPRSN